MSRIDDDSSAVTVDAPAGWREIIAESTSSAIAAVRMHPLRSLLTTVGITIGVASIIAVVAVMQGLAGGIVRSLDTFAPDMVIVRADTPAREAMLGQRNRLSYEDFLAVKARVTDLRHISVRLHPLGLPGGVRFEGRAFPTQVAGTDASYQEVVSMHTRLGRFLTESDDLHRRRVAVIGPTVQRELGLPDDPLGSFIELAGEWFRVVGVGEARGPLFGYDQDSYVYVPFSTLRALVGAREEETVDIYFRPADATRMPAIEQQIRTILRARAGIPEDKADPYLFQSADGLKASFADLLRSVSLVAGTLMGISLLVGGVGIMNIMLVSVTERTREIGILKAIGAPPTFILAQFLTEAIVLSALGGLVGVLLGLAFAAVLGAMVPMLSGGGVPAWAVLLAMGFSSSVGVVFGLAPALKAARLSPVEALRHE